MKQVLVYLTKFILEELVVNKTYKLKALRISLCTV